MMNRNYKSNIKLGEVSSNFFIKWSHILIRSDLTCSLQNCVLNKEALVSQSHCKAKKQLALNLRA